VAFDTLPVRRASIVQRMLNGERIAKSTSVISYDLEDLAHLGILKPNRMGTTMHLTGPLQALLAPEEQKESLNALNR
jgi:hypothetical protein